MKENWRCCVLGDAITLQRGFDLPERDRVEGEVPIVSSSGVTGYHSTYKVKAPGVVTGRYGTLGEVHYVTKDFWPLNTTLYVKSFNGNLPLFIAYFIRTLDFSSQNAAGAVPGVNRNHLHMMKVRIPPLPTQRKIAGILSAYDDLIENNTRRIAILEEMAQAIYREWFVNFRFPGHEKVKLVDSPLGKIPAGWRITSLNDILTVLETGSRPKGGVSEIKEGVPSIGAENIMGAGQYDFAKTKYVPLEFFQRMRQGILCDRDVLVYKDGGKPGYFIPHISIVGSGFPYSEMVINSHVYRLRASSPFSQELLYYHLSSEEMLHWMHLHGGGAAIPSIARKDLQRLPVMVPPAEIASRFTMFAEPTLTQILILARKNQNLRQTRDLLLPKLISGKLDVEELDIDIGEPLAEAEK